MDTAHALFKQYQHNPPVSKNQPPVAGAIAWERSLFLRIKHTIIRFQAVEDMMTSDYGKAVSLSVNCLTQFFIFFSKEQKKTKKRKKIKLVKVKAFFFLKLIGSRITVTLYSTKSCRPHLSVLFRIRLLLFFLFSLMKHFYRPGINIWAWLVR